MGVYSQSNLNNKQKNNKMLFIKVNTEQLATVRNYFPNSGYVEDLKSQCMINQHHKRHRLCI